MRVKNQPIKSFCASHVSRRIGVTKTMRVLPTLRPMSVMQIIDELSKLTPADLLAVRRKLIEISEENEGVSLCDAAALEGAQLLDQMEAGDGAR